MKRSFDKMLYVCAVIMAEFGKGKIAVGCNKLANDENWFIRITQIKNLKDYKIGDTVAKDDVHKDSEIILIFPTEYQMLNVMAAFTNRTYEQMFEKWSKLKAEKESLDWVIASTEGI